MKEVPCETEAFRVIRSVYSFMVRTVHTKNMFYEGIITILTCLHNPHNAKLKFFFSMYLTFFLHFFYKDDRENFNFFLFKILPHNQSKLFPTLLEPSSYLNEMKLIL